MISSWTPSPGPRRCFSAAWSGAPVPRVATKLTFSASARTRYSEAEGSGVCFERKFWRWHDMCIGKPAMLKAKLPRHDTDPVLAGRAEKDH